MVAGMSLSHRLDKDILAIVQKFVDDEFSPLPPLHDVLAYIYKSNSSVKRRPKKQLEQSIERVLEALRDDQQAGDSDLDAIEGDFADMTGPTRDSRGINKSLTRMWTKNVTAPTANASLSATSRTVPSPATPPKASGPEPDMEPLKRSKPPQEKPVKRRKLSDGDRLPLEHVRLDQLGGIEPVIDQLEDLLTLPLLRPDVFESGGFAPPRGILLHGPPGCGKTAIANAMAAAMQVPFISISAPSVVSGMSGESERALRDHFEEAKKIAPCIVFIDEIDAITAKRESAQKGMEARIVAQLLTCMDDLSLEKTGGKPVIVMAATNRPDSIDPALRRGGRFDIEIHMPIPDEAARRGILEALTCNLPLDGELQLAHLAKRTAGFVGADLKDLVNRASWISLRRFRLTLQSDDSDMQVDTGITSGLPQHGQNNSNGVNGRSAENFANTDKFGIYHRLERVRQSQKTPASVQVSQADFEQALPLVQPSAKREGFATVPDTTWQHIGALSAVREELMDSVVEPIQNPELYSSLGITAPAGVLLWGPPGCGKTLLAKAVANESKANFISVKGPELMNKYVGESEREVRRLFARARSSVPCIIFFDELESLVPRRGSEMTESSLRVVNTLLTELDGLDKRDGIYVIGATNRPDLIEPAMLRPGRLETPIFVDLPGPDERVQILETQCRMAGNTFSDGIADIAKACELFSGADLEALRRRAGKEALKRIRRLGPGSNGQSETTSMGLADWQSASKLISPSVDERTQRMFKKLRKTFGNAVIEGREEAEGA